MNLEYHRKLDRLIIIPLAIAVILVWVGVVAQGTYAFEYEDKIFPGITIGEYDFSGMTREEAAVVVREFREALSAQGLTFVFMDINGLERSMVVYPYSFVTDDEGKLETSRFADIDVGATVGELFKVGRRGTFLKRWQDRVLARKSGIAVTAVTDIDEEAFLNVLRANMRPDEQPAKDAKVIYEGGAFFIQDGSQGVFYPVEDKVKLAIQMLSQMKLEPIRMVGLFDEPKIVRKEIESFLPWLPKIVELGGIQFTYEDVVRRETKTWKFASDCMASALQISKNEDDALVVALDTDVIYIWIKDNIAPDVEIERQSAVFEWTEGAKKVTKFVPGRDGISINEFAVGMALNQAIQERYNKLLKQALASDLSMSVEGEFEGKEHKTESIEVAVIRTEPEVKTGGTNDLGIKEILGVGTSDYSGSPHNRIKNIGNAVRKLDGLLIAPNEQFSLLEALRPFNHANGYLEELVIKGDEIKPEIAGGLCQIGTTSFRMAMNSGMPVTERQNHSLVVSYYNDPNNGNPGTDATIYEPRPDFRFINDTGFYLLWTAHMDTESRVLEFALWGTSDGRKGYYSAPVVHRWIATGPERIIETKDLPLGERECQSSHPGAEASFTYTRELANGEKEEIVYESYYRPLPKICLLGKEPEPEPEPVPEGIPWFWLSPQ